MRELLADANKLYAAKGKKTLKVNLKSDSVGDEDIAKFLLGPTGNLRAPTLVLGKIVVIGFNQELYEEVFG